MALIEVVVSMLILAVAALAVNATISIVNSKAMRSAGGSSLDLQAMNYARETLETLKNAVSTDSPHKDPLYDNTYTPPCSTAAGTRCGTVAGASFTQTLPALSDIFTKGAGTRTYKVWDISSGTGTLGNDVAYKKVTVTVQWTD